MEGNNKKWGRGHDVFSSENESMFIILREEASL